jgi:tRNA(adenine34) deaminase
MATKKAAKKSAKKTSSGKRSTTPPSRRWSAKVTTDSTKPAPGLFKKSAKSIAESLAKKSVSPKSPGQGMQMLSFYENRAGKNLSAERKQTLEHAKDLLREKEGKSPAKKSGTKKLAQKKSAKTSAQNTSAKNKPAKNKPAKKSARKASK